MATGAGGNRQVVVTVLSNQLAASACEKVIVQEGDSERTPTTLALMTRQHLMSVPCKLFRYRALLDMHIKPVRMPICIM